MNTNKQLCDHGCGKEAKYKFKNGKWCCEPHAKKCPVNRKIMSDRLKGRKRSKEFIERYLLGENNPLFGKSHSEETKKKISEGRKGKYGGKNAGFYGKHHTKEAKEKLRQTRLGRTVPKKVREKIGNSLRGENNPGYGIPRTEEVKRKISETKKRKYASGEIIPPNKGKFGKDHPTYGRKLNDEERRRISEMMKRKRGDPNSYWNSKEHREKLSRSAKEKCLNGHAAYMNSFIKNPSKPQVELFKLTKKLYPEAKLNYPIFEVNKNIDVCIPHLKIAIEYDGSYWHQNELYDKARQKEIETLGYKFIRYRDRVPSLKELVEDIEKLEEVISV